MAHSKVPAQWLSRRATLFGGAGSVFMAGLGNVPAWGEQTLKDRGLDSIIVDVIREKFGDLPHSLVVLIPSGSGANLAPIVAAFERKTSVKIQLIEADTDGINTELMLDTMLGGNKYDVALPATFGLSDLVLAQAVLPLDAYKQRHEPDGFRKGVLYQGGDEFEGHTYGFQTDGDAYLMFYNNKMLGDPSLQKRYADRFGIDLDVPLTWAELDRQMLFFHNPDQNCFGGAMFRTPQYLVWEWWIRFHSKGIWPLSSEMSPQIDGDAGIAALEEMIAITQAFVPGTTEMGLFENWKRYARGDIYANIGWGGTQKYLNGPKSKMRGKMSFGPMPGGKFGDETIPMPYFNWGWSYVVSATSSEPELAYLFSLFAASPEMSTRAVRQADGFFDPFRPEHYDDPGIIKAYSGSFLEVQRASLEQAIPDFYLKGRSEYFSALADGLDQALQGEIKPEAALKRVAQNWQLITSRAGRVDQIRRWQELRSQYPVAVRRVLRDLT
ncbi:MAG: extracellular solute-binding protein [Sulfitobacter sp.]